MLVPALTPGSRDSQVLPFINSCPALQQSLPLPSMLSPCSFGVLPRGGGGGGGAHLVYLQLFPPATNVHFPASGDDAKTALDKPLSNSPSAEKSQLLQACLHPRQPDYSPQGGKYRPPGSELPGGTSGPFLILQHPSASLSAQPCPLQSLKVPPQPRVCFPGN